MLPIPKGGDKSDPGNINAEDIDAMVEKQGIAPIGEGDCVSLYTGWGNVWHPREWDSFDAAEKSSRIAKFNSGEPAFGASACQYLADKKFPGNRLSATVWSLAARFYGRVSDHTFTAPIQ